jgi:hypothetical protein
MSWASRRVAASVNQAKDLTTLSPRKGCASTFRQPDRAFGCVVNRRDPTTESFAQNDPIRYLKRPSLSFATEPYCQAADRFPSLILAMLILKTCTATRPSPCPVRRIRS